jgi:hypothetical protein
MKSAFRMSLREYMACDWVESKPKVKRAVLEMGCIYAAAEAKNNGIPFTPLYWNEMSEGKWLYSLWEIE